MVERKKRSGVKTFGAKPITATRKSIEFDFLNKSQEDAWKSIHKHDITFLSGVAGTAKTFLAMAYAIDAVLGGRASRIVITRPIVEAGESIGFLPGELHNKVWPFLEPALSAIAKLSGADDELKKQIMSALDIKPLAYLQGVTLDNAVCVLDEAQNTTHSQLLMYLSRIGSGTKMILCGDAKQSNIRGSKFELVAEQLTAIPQIGWHKFTKADIVRHPIIGQITDIMETIK